MTRRYEDFDEFCDPDNPKVIKYEDVVEAAARIKNYILPTPYTEYKCHDDNAINVSHKLETVLRTGSFKERGALNALLLLAADKKKIGVILASLGNQAMGFCYYGQKLGVPMTVVMPLCVPIIKLQRVRNFGAKVVVQGETLPDAQRFARAIAKDKGLTYINGRDHPHIIAGYGTVGLEIMEQMPGVDAILVPIGTGGLAAGIVTVVKHLKPECLVYGVQPEKMPTFFKSLEFGDPVSLPFVSSLASGIAMPYIGVNSFQMLKSTLDKMLLVEEDWIARAILQLVEKERVVAEGAAACGLAAILGNLVPEFKTKNVVCIATGGNIDTTLLGRCLDRGLAAEGRLIKFKVGIRDTSTAQEELLRLIANGGFNVQRQFQDRIWVENEIYRVEVKLVCEARGLEHALELKRIIEKAYPNASIFETEPFNDTSTCPCYIKKS